MDPIDFSQLRSDIFDCTTIEQFVHVVDHHPLFRAALTRLQQVLQAGDGNAVSVLSCYAPFPLFLYSRTCFS